MKIENILEKLSQGKTVKLTGGRQKQYRQLHEIFDAWGGILCHACNRRSLTLWAPIPPKGYRNPLVRDSRNKAA